MQALRALGVCVAIGLSVGCASRPVRPAIDTAASIHDRTGLAVAPPRTAGQTTGLPPGFTLDRPLSRDDAAAIAVWKNPQLHADLAALGLARADVIDAGLLRNPRLDVLFPVGLKPFELIMNLPVELLLQRPRRVAASQAAYDQLAQSLVQNGLNVARDARLAHADLELAADRVEIAKRSVELRDRVAAATEARLRAGDISELETITARTELGAAREQLVRFEHDVAIAVERLRFVLGLAAERPALRVTAIPPSSEAPSPVSDLVEKAMVSRADLRAAELAVTTAAKRANWERSRFLWLTAQLSSKEVGTSGVLTGPGASIELPIFNRNQGLIARANADVEVASRAYLAVKQRVAFEVAEARAMLMQAQESLRRLRADVLPPLLRAVAVAESQYRNGDVSLLFVLEQTRGLVDTQFRVVDAEAAIRRAEAQLERSVGSR